jgi:hypothetical protein
MNETLAFGAINNNNNNNRKVTELSASISRNCNISNNILMLLFASLLFDCKHYTDKNVLAILERLFYLRTQRFGSWLCFRHQIKL